jgi:hypothetical protein
MMILHCNFEELRALVAGADLVLRDGEQGGGGVAAPPEALARVEELKPRLVGDLTVETLLDQRAVRLAVAVICQKLQKRMEVTVVEHSPADETAINLYFDFGHARTVLHRLDQMGEEMRAIIEVANGEPVNETSAASFNFPD